MTEMPNVSLAVYPNHKNVFCWSLRVPFSRNGLVVLKTFIDLMDSIQKTTNLVRKEPFCEKRLRQNLVVTFVTGVE